MDTFDAFLTNTDCFQADLFPSDLQEVEPLLSDGYDMDMDIDPLGLFDFTDVRDDPFFSEELPSDDNQKSSGSSTSSSTYDLSSERSIQHTVDIVNFDHNYAATPRLYDDGVLATSCEMQKSETSISFPSLQETCYVGVEDSPTSFFDSLFSSDVFKTGDDVMWSSYSSGNSTGEFSPDSTNIEDEEQMNEEISPKPEPDFHECSINELAKKHVEAELPNFKPIVLSAEEKLLLIEEGVTLPTDLPLTRSEERVLKKVRRKIRNKRSAKVSRQKKKDYIDGLESQISESNGLNRTLLRRVDVLQKKNTTLQQQLRRLMTYVKIPIHKTTQATPCLLVLLLSFGLFLTPNLSRPSPDAEGNIQVPSGHRTRKVLEYKVMNEQQSYLVQWFHQMMNVYNPNKKLPLSDLSGIEPFKDLTLVENQEIITKPEEILQQPPDYKNSTTKINVPAITLTAQTLTKENRPNSSIDEFLDGQKLHLKTTTFVPPKDESSLLTVE